MATCTAPKTGRHKDDETKAQCPACGPRSVTRAPVVQPEARTLSDLQVGDVAYLRSDYTGARSVSRVTIARRTGTQLVIKRGSVETKFDAKSGRMKGGSAYGPSATLSLGDKETLREYHATRRNALISSAKDILGGEVHAKRDGDRYPPGQLSDWDDESFRSATLASRRTRSAMLLASQDKEDALSPRDSVDGKPFPYTDDDVLAVSGTVSHAVAPLLVSLGEDYRAGMMRAFLPVTSKAELLSLMSVVGTLREDEDLRERQKAEDADDALLHQLMRLQGYEKKVR